MEGILDACHQSREKVENAKRLYEQSKLACEAYEKILTSMCINREIASFSAKFKTPSFCITGISLDGLKVTTLHMNGITVDVRAPNAHAYTVTYNGTRYLLDRLSQGIIVGLHTTDAINGLRPEVMLQVLQVITSIASLEAKLNEISADPIYYAEKK